MTLIHFHLNLPINVNGKATSDVQLYREVSTAEDDTNDRNMTDQQAYEAEQRENDKFEANKKEFLDWSKNSEPIVQRIDSMFVFDVPCSTICIDGNIGSNRQEMLAAANSLVCLTEWPPQIVSLDNVEFVAVERFQPLETTSKSFDISFVGKDLKSVWTLTSVPVKKYDEVVLEWASMLEIILVVTKQSVEWHKMLADVRTDLQTFVDEGCWAPIIEVLDPVERSEDKEDNKKKKLHKQVSQESDNRDRSKRDIAGNIDDENSSNDGEFSPKSDSDSDEDMESDDDSNDQQESEDESDSDYSGKKKRKAKNTNGTDKKMKL